MGGVVNISRRIWTDEAFEPEPFTEREAFMWLIMEASYKPRVKRINGCPIQLKRGQLAASIRFMAEAWKWSKSRVDRFLNRSVRFGVIETASGTGINIITICKYEAYQLRPKGSGTASGTPLGTADGTASGTGESDASYRNDYTIPEEEEGSGTASGTASGTGAGQERDKPNTDAIQVQDSSKTLVISKNENDVSEKKPKKYEGDLEEALTLFNEMAERTGLAKVQKMNKARNGQLRGRLEDLGGLDGWKDALGKIEASHFLTGRNGGRWKATFDFIIRESSIIKIMEGNYEQSNNAGGTGRDTAHSRYFQQVANYANSIKD